MRQELSAMAVKDLRLIANLDDIKCEDCFEKADLVTALLDGCSIHTSN